jgi:cell division protein FtsL
MIGESSRAHPAISPRITGTRSSTRTVVPGRLLERPAIGAERSTALPQRLERLVGDSTPVRLMLATVLVAIAFLLYLAQASQASVIDLNIGYLQAESAQLNVENTNLRTTAATFRSTQRISLAAINHLHMVQPDMAHTVWVRAAFPTVAPPIDGGADSRRAQQRSQPLAWTRRLVSFVRASLW